MRDLNLSARGKAAYGGLCVVCCGLPMLVTLGILSIGVAFAVGASIASAVGVVATAYLVARRRLIHVPAGARRMLTIGGTTMSGLGLWLANESADVAPVVLSVAVAALSTAALLALSASNAPGRTAA